MIRRDNEAVRVVLGWSSQGIRPKGRPRKRWNNVIEEDLKTLGV